MQNKASGAGRTEDVTDGPRECGALNMNTPIL